MQYSTNGIIIAKGSTHQALTPLSTHHQAEFSKNEKTVFSMQCNSFSFSCFFLHYL